ncbi:hypothetical protein P691DRAFT_727879 [Macrolepiota fuliginosa MF-IS2]|uniref:DUF6534 domain-containing protein n=1 Tax=Macrolepiota fuliginosa MF-IS2 TaxID=1400762 RepID=A0A9P6C5R2_9AGAR|nr:hypothetical protein P691DRAFT_727879 [Macrolepiota fuliginosa MF-IS2]
MADSPTLPPLPPNLGNITGPPFIGIFLNGYLFGLLTLQYYNYCSNFRNDLTWLRNLVHIQFVLETAQTAMTVADGFHWFVYGYGDLTKLGEYYLANFDSPIICSIIALISQGVYCWRIYFLSKWRVPTLIIALAACCQAVGGFGIGIVNQRIGTIEGWDPKFNVFMILWSTCSAIADTLIACFMTYLLLSSKQMTSRRSKPTVMSRLIRLVIETNAASALVAMAVLLTTVIEPIAPPKTSYFLCPGYVLGKLYSNSFITMLNNRRRSGADGGSDELSASNNESISLDRRNHRSTPSRQLKHVNMSGVAVNIHTETAIRLDGEELTFTPKQGSRSMLPDMS